MLKVKIKNFQSVANTEFEVDGFTVIVGKNNRGKSAIVRAIDSALSNRLGNNFIRWGKLQTEVGLIKDDLDVSWIKEEKTASYNINKKPYTSLNRAVPQPILDAGYKKFEIGDEKINPLIAHQFEELFLINRSGPFVTEAISTLYDLNDINDADSLCQKKLRATKNLLKTRHEDTNNLKKKLDKFDGLEEVKQKWETLKKLFEKADVLDKAISEIEEFSSEYESQKNLVNTLKNVPPLKVPTTKGVETLIADYSWVAGIQKKLETSQKIVKGLQGISKVTLPGTDKPRQLIADFEWLNKTIEIFHKSLQMVQKLKGVGPLTVPDIKKPEILIQEVSTLTSVEGKLKDLVGSCNQCKNVLAELKSLDGILTKVTAIEGQVETVSYLTGIDRDFSFRVKTFKELKASYDSAVQELNSAQTSLDAFKVCPLCNNPLGHTHE